MPNFLQNVQNFYFGEGVVGLIDEVGGVSIPEVGTVGENLADGPPPDPTRSSRGPCSQGTTGFRKTTGDYGFLDVRAGSGVLPRTMAAWWRLDSLSGDQNVMSAMAQSSPALFHYIGRYEHAFTTWIVHLHDGTSEVASGAANPDPVVAGEWNFSGWSYDGQGNVYVHHNGYTRHASSTFLGFKRTGLVNTQFGLEFLTTEPGLLGDLSYIFTLDVALNPDGWARFWNDSFGRRYPDQFRWDDDAAAHAYFYDEGRDRHG